MWKIRRTRTTACFQVEVIPYQSFGQRERKGEGERSIALNSNPRGMAWFHFLSTVGLVSLSVFQQKKCELRASTDAVAGLLKAALRWGSNINQGAKQSVEQGKNVSRRKEGLNHLQFTIIFGCGTTDEQPVSTGQKHTDTKWKFPLRWQFSSSWSSVPNIHFEKKTSCFSSIVTRSLHGWSRLSLDWFILVGEGGLP